MDDEQRTGQADESEALGAGAEATSSGSQPESESGFMNRLLRGARGFIGLGSDEAGDREAGADGGTTEDDPDAETVTLSKAELDERIRREAQSQKDRELARERREREQQDATNRTAAEWERIKTLAREGDVWALGEIAAREVREREQAEAANQQYAETFARTAPTWDATYLDPLLAKLPEDVWKPIVGDGLGTLEDRKAAVEKAIDAHRASAVADALTDAKFVRELVGSQVFRAALLKSPVVRQQLNAVLRGSDDYDEPEHVAGLDRANLPGNENEDMNARIRGVGLSVVSGRSTRRRERGNRDLIE